MLSYAMDNVPPTTIILITGDRDFAYAAAVLRLRQYQVVVVAPTLPTPHLSLKSQASVLLNWNTDILDKANQDPSTLNQTTLEQQQSPSSRCRSTSVPESSASYSRLSPSPRARRDYRLAVHDDDYDVTTGSPSGEPKEEDWTDEPQVATRKYRSTQRSQSPAAGPALFTHTDTTSTLQVAAEEGWTSISEDDLPQTLSCGEADNDYESAGWVKIRTDAENSVCPRALEDLKETRQSMEEHDCSSVSSTSDAEWKMYVTTFDPFGEGNTVGCAEEQTFAFGESKTPARPATTSPASSNAITNAYWRDVPTSPSPRRLSTTSESGITFLDRGKLHHIAEEHVPAGPSTKDGVEARETGTGDLNSNSQQHPRGESTHPSIPKLPVDSTQTHASASTPTPTVPSALPVADPVPFLAPDSSSAPQTAPTQAPNQLSLQNSVTLVEILKMASQNGITLPTRSSVATLLLKRDPAVFQRCGVKNFNEYVVLANNDGIVQLGIVSGGEAWITLHPDFQATLPSTNFAALVDILREAHRDGNMFPSRSCIATTLQKRDPMAYQRSGVTKFRQFTALAEKAGIVRLGQLNGGDWISLHPNWQATT